MKRIPSIRTLLAFLIAPASFGLLLFLLSFLSTSMGVGFWVLGFVSMISYPIAIFIGIPLYVILKKYRITEVLIYSLIVLVSTTLLVAYFVIRPLMSQSVDFSSLLLPPHLFQIAIIFFASSFTMFVFWLIARPDKQVKSQN